MNQTLDHSLETKKQLHLDYVAINPNLLQGWTKFVNWISHPLNPPTQTHQDNQTLITSLHPDLLREIFVYLPIKDALQCKRCCKYFLNAFDDLFWKQVLEKEHAIWNRLRTSYHLREYPLYKNPKQGWVNSFRTFVRFHWEEDRTEPEMKTSRGGLSARKTGMGVMKKLQTQMLAKTKMDSNGIYSMFFMVDWCREGGLGFGFMQKLTKTQREKCVLKSLGSFKGIINYAYYNNGHILGSCAQPCANREEREYQRGDVVGFVLDRKEGVVEFFRNGVSQAKINDLYLTAAADLFAAVDFWWEGSQMTLVECKRLDSWPDSSYIECQQKVPKLPTVTSS